MSYDAFVSYATPDRALTMALVDDLESRGLKCWIAPRDVPGGSKYAEVILQALADSKVFLLVFSENSNASEHVQREVERALNSGKQIVPVRIADVLPSGAMDYYLATLHWIDAFGAAKEGSFEVTANALAGVLGRELIDPVPAEAETGAKTGSVASGQPPQPATAPTSADSGFKGKADSNRMPLVISAVVLALVAGALTIWKTVDWGADDGGGAGGPSKVPVAEQAADEGADAGSGQKVIEMAKVDPPVAEPVPTPGKEKNKGKGQGKEKEAEKEKVEIEAEVKGPVMVETTTDGPKVDVEPPVPPKEAATAGLNLAGAKTEVMPVVEKIEPADPVIEALAAASKAWAAGERETATKHWMPVLALPEGEITRDRLGEEGVALLRRTVAAAAEMADQGVAGNFAALNDWRAVVDFSEQIGIDDLAAQRGRFEQGWKIAEVEAQWEDGQREAVADSLSAIAASGEMILARVKDANDGLGVRLRELLQKVAVAAADGRLGTQEVLTQRWQPALQMAMESGGVEAIGVMATLAWTAGDSDAAASRLEEYEKLTRGAEALDPAVADLLTKVISEAKKGSDKVKGEKWQAALNFAFEYEIPGSLQVLADATHARDPGAAAPLYRQLFEQTTAGGSLRTRIGFSLQMLKRYDIGDEATFYRTQLQDAFESTLETLDQPTSGDDLFEQIPEIRNAADAGIPAAQYIMGDLLSDGKGMEKDPGLAFEYYQKAADADYARAKYAVGECYRDGRGTAQDRDKTLSVWRAMSDEEAAEVPLMLLNLAALSSSDKEKQQLYAKARVHFEARVTAGQVARYSSGLGQMLLSGWGGEPDAKRGFELLEQAAELGSSQGAFLAGLVLAAEGEPFVGMRSSAGIDFDEAKGEEFIKAAARQGYPGALQWCQDNEVPFQE